MNVQTDLQSTQEKCCVIVCPYSTGCTIALDLQLRGYHLLCVWPRGFCDTMKAHVPAPCKGKLKYDVEMDEADSVGGTAGLVEKVAAQRKWSISACVCGGEAGVDLTDALSEELGLMTNGTAVSNRRDKKVQQELIKAAGLRSVRQASGSCFEDVREFLESESYPLIIKPLESAGSDGVKLIHSYQEAKDYTKQLLGSEMVNGGCCHEILCQEFLKGKEYVVDCCSRDGVHKVVMIWVYDKRAANGAFNVYYGAIPVDPESPEAKLLMPYARGCLDAIALKHGPTHNEIIMTADGPCLVEMNCRAHGKDGHWRPLCRALTGGYDQIDAAVASYVDPVAFEKLPAHPPSPFDVQGRCIDMVSYHSGTVKAMPGYDIIRALPSFVCMTTHIRPGSKVRPTIDLATDVGSLVVMNEDGKTLARDIAVIRQLELSNGMFVFEEEEEQQYSAAEPEEDLLASDLEWNKKRLQLLLKACSLDLLEEGRFRTVHRQNTSFYRSIAS